MNIEDAKKMLKVGARFHAGRDWDGREMTAIITKVTPKLVVFATQFNRVLIVCDRYMKPEEVAAFLTEGKWTPVAA